MGKNQSTRWMPLLFQHPNLRFRPSGLRLGLPAMTTRGIREEDARTIGDFIDRALKNADDVEFLKALREEVRTFCHRFPVVRAKTN